MSVRSLKGGKSGQWKWALHWIQALFWGYYCFWLSLEIGWLLFIPVGGLQPNLWPKLSQRTGKHKLKIVAILFKFNTEIVRNLITAERLRFSNLPFRRERDWKKTSSSFQLRPERCQSWEATEGGGTECPLLLFCSQSEGWLWQPLLLWSEGFVGTPRSLTPCDRDHTHCWCSPLSEWPPASMPWQFRAWSLFKKQKMSTSCLIINKALGRGKAVNLKKKKITLNKDAIFKIWWKNVLRDFYNSWELTISLFFDKNNDIQHLSFEVRQYSFLLGRGNLILLYCKRRQL